MSEVRRPDWLTAVQVGPNPATLPIRGKTYFYTLVKANLEKRLPYTVGGHIADNSLFISEDVPADFRPFILRHEIFHDTILRDMPPENACVEALKLELEEAREALRDRYPIYLYGKKEVDGFSGRIEFFNALAELYQDPEQAKARGTAFVEGVKRACDYLNGLNS